MNENTAKRIIAFTSQSLKQYGIRSIRMDVIAKNMNVSKRTIYQVYETKNNLISLCFESYSDRTHNLFQIIKYNSSNSLIYLWEIVKAYISNLFKAKCVFWLDLDKHYQYIGTAIQDIWLKELDSAIQICQDEGYVMPDLNISMFLESFTQLLYHARMAESLLEMLYNSAYFMLKGIMTINGIGLLAPIKNDFISIAKNSFKAQN